MSLGEELTNSEIFLWALHQLGGNANLVDVETVFIECFKVAPRRFSWRTREDIPDYKKCSKALRDADAKRPPLMVKTRDGFGRQLTVEGQRWIEVNSKRLRKLLTGGQVIQEPKQRPRSRLLAEAESSSVYLTWLSDRIVPSEKWKIAELLRCSPDSNRQIWTDRLQTLRSAAYHAERKKLLEYLDSVVRAHSDWFEGEGNED